MDCGAPPRVANSSMKSRTGGGTGNDKEIEQTYGAFIVYTCNEGFRGSGTTSCRDDGLWYVHTCC